MNVRMRILLIAVALFAVPAFGRILPIEDSYSAETATYDMSTYMDNPCTAVQDWVAVDYHVYLYEQRWDSKSRFFFDESTSMGSSKYAASGATQSDVAYTTPFTLRKYHKVNTPDDFHVVTVIDFDPSTRSTSVSIETACGDGLPDSKE